MGDRIVRDPAILSGKPVVNGTRIPVEVVLEYLADNPNFDELFADYPRLTIDDVKACLAFAQKRVKASPRPMPVVEMRLHVPGEGVSPADVADASSLWQQLRMLEGQTLPTISGRARFNVMEVDATRALLVIHSSGSRHAVTRRGLERAAAQGLVVAGVTPGDLREAEIEHATYLAAIINAILR